MVRGKSCLRGCAFAFALVALGCAPLPDESMSRESVRAVVEGSATANTTLRFAPGPDPLRLYAVASNEIAVRGAPPRGVAHTVIALERYGRVIATFNVGSARLPARWYIENDDISDVRRFRVSYFDSNGSKLADRWDWFRDPVIVGEGSACDADGVEVRCASPTYCATAGRSARCEVMQPIAIAEARTWTRGTELRGFARVDGSRQPRLEWRVVAGGVELRPWSSASTQRIEGAWLLAWGSAGPAMAPDAVVEWRTRVTIPGTTIDVVGPTMIGERQSGAGVGTPCPFAGETASAEMCDEGLRCAAGADGRFACRAVPERCSLGLPQFDDVPAMPAGGSSSIEVAPTSYTRNCITACNERATVTGAFRFVAPRAGRYTFRWSPREPVSYLAPIALRYSCRTYENEATEVCTPRVGEQRGVGSRTMAAGEEILVMPFEGNRAATLTVTSE